MIVPRDLNLDVIENLLLQLASPESRILRIPSKVSLGGAFGVDTAFLQFLVTWARRHQDSCLHLYCDSNEIVPFINRFKRAPFALTALIMANSLHDEKHNVLNRRDVLSQALDIVDAMYVGDLKATTGHGKNPSSINLLCISNAAREFIKPLYSSERFGNVRSRGEFRSLLTDSFSILLGKSGIRGFSADHIDAMSGLIYELFANTDEHATTDVNGDFYGRAVRGLVIKRHRVKNSDVFRFCGDQPEFNRYFLKRNANNIKPHLDAIEISIFDSGPGLARRWLSTNEDISLEEEQQATRTCFEKYLTTKHTVSSGLGLFQVIQSLSYLQGFLRIRTGRVSLFQSFDRINKEVQFQPKNWHEAEELAYVEGSLFTICLPVN